MTVRILGAAVLMAGCWGFGLSICACHHQEVRLLRALLKALQEMQWELKFRLTPLPELCRMAAKTSCGCVRQVFQALWQAMDSCAVSEVSGCMNGLLEQIPMPPRVRQCMKSLGDSLGRFDLEGQLQGLGQSEQLCREALTTMEAGSSERLRTYQTLALCAGAAMVILFI